MKERNQLRKKPLIRGRVPAIRDWPPGCGPLALRRLLSPISGGQEIAHLSDVSEDEVDAMMEGEMQSLSDVAGCELESEAVEANSEMGEKEIGNVPGFSESEFEDDAEAEIEISLDYAGSRTDNSLDYAGNKSEFEDVAEDDIANSLDTEGSENEFEYAMQDEISEIRIESEFEDVEEDEIGNSLDFARRDSDFEYVAEDENGYSLEFDDMEENWDDGIINSVDVARSEIEIDDLSGNENRNDKIRKSPDVAEMENEDKVELDVEAEKEIRHGPKRRRVSAVRDWPPGCGPFAFRKDIGNLTDVWETEVEGSEDKTENDIGNDEMGNSPDFAGRDSEFEYVADDENGNSLEFEDVAEKEIRRGPKRRKVSAIRDWPPGCGPFAFRKDIGNLTDELETENVIGDDEMGNPAAVAAAVDKAFELQKPIPRKRMSAYRTFYMELPSSRFA